MKLDKVMLHGSKSVEIADFGFSMCLEKTEIYLSESANMYKETPLYWSPEILLEHEYTMVCDVYAFGMVACIVISNEVPFRDCKLEKLKAKIVSGSRPDLDAIIGSTHRSLIMRCLDHY